MKAILTPSNPAYSLILVDTETKSEVRLMAQHEEGDDGADESRPRHRPFGITWSGDRVFVANRRHVCIYDRWKIAEYSKLLNRNSDGHKVAIGGSLTSFLGKFENVLCQNPHGLTMAGNRLLTACTSHDCVAIIDPETGAANYWHVDNGMQDSLSGEDTRHINSLVYACGTLFILSNNRRKRFSSIVAAKIENGVIEKLWEKEFSETHQAHGIGIKGNGFITLDTGNHRTLNFLCEQLRQYNPEIPVDDFLRGLASTADELLFCHFPRQFRRYRGQGDSILRIIDGLTLIDNGRIKLTDIGAVNELRLLDQYDYCHHQKPLDDAFSYPSDRI